jgi:hypothetical protein
MRGEECCGNCRFYDPLPKEPEEGTCRHYPPVLVEVALKAVAKERDSGDAFDRLWGARNCASWQPMTYSENWCGEWQAEKSS